jgi:hypothetical protein
VRRGQKVDMVGHMSAAAECAIVATCALVVTGTIAGLGVWFGGGRELAASAAWGLGITAVLLYGLAIFMRIMDGPAPQRYAWRDHR